VADEVFVEIAQRCLRCDKIETILVAKNDANNLIKKFKCDKCGGIGVLGEKICDNCGGTGIKFNWGKCLKCGSNDWYLFYVVPILTKKYGGKNWETQKVYLFDSVVWREKLQKQGYPIIKIGNARWYVDVYLKKLEKKKR